MNRSFITAMALLLSLACHSQSFQVENFSIESGLPSNEAYYVYQDKKGFIWFATDNGVVRFDGAEMKTYHVKQGLVDPVVFGFHEDAKGRIWFRSFSGKLAYYHNDTITAYSHNRLISSLVRKNLIYSIYYDSSETLWFDSGREVINIDKNGKVGREVIKEFSVFYKTLNSNASIVGSYGNPDEMRFINIDGKEFPLEMTGKGVASNVIQLTEWHGDLFFSLGKNIFKYDGVSVATVFESRTAIISLSKDNQDNLWVGYRNEGVERFTNDKFSAPWTPSFISNLSVTKVLEDNEGGLWFTTLEKGAYYVPKPAVENFILPHQNKIKAVTRNSNSVMVGDFKGHLIAIDSRTKKTAWKKSFSAPIIALFTDSKQNVWVSTTTETIEFSKDFDLITPDSLDFETKLDFSESEGFLWLLDGTRITRIDSSRRYTFRRHESFYRAICATRSHLYLAGRTGLEIYSKEMKYQSSPPLLLNLKITDIVKANDSTVLLATSGSGFFLLNENTLHATQFNMENNLMANDIYAALFYDSLLWLGTENGIIRTNAEKLLRGEPQFKYLNKKSGLSNNKVNYLVKVENSIWAFTENGVTVIPDSLRNFTNPTPSFYIKGILVNQVPVDLLTRPELAHHQNDITISFGFISFNNNESIRTRFRLSEKDPWVYAENRELQFFSLSPGAYALSLEYSMDNNHWVAAIDQLIFFINPPWWRAWYYQLIGLLITAFSILLYFKWRLRRSRKQQQLHQQKLLQTEIQTTERERSRIAKDLHDTVGTNLAAVKMAVSQLLRKHHEPLSENIESQLQEIINETRAIIYHLVPPGLERLGLFTLARNHITKLNHTTQPTINLSTSGDDVYNAHLNIIIFRIIQELLSNSLKHAKATTITIAINTFESHVNFLYEDNGTGFNRVEKKEGFGIVNIQSRIESLQGNIKFETGSSGTSYTINIPYTESEDMHQMSGRNP